MHTHTPDDDAPLDRVTIPAFIDPTITAAEWAKWETHRAYVFAVIDPTNFTTRAEQKRAQGWCDALSMPAFFNPRTPRIEAAQLANMVALIKGTIDKKTFEWLTLQEALSDQAQAQERR